MDCREPDDDWQEKERLVEEAVERLDIVIVDSDPRLLLQLVNPISHICLMAHYMYTLIGTHRMCSHIS